MPIRVLAPGIIRTLDYGIAAALFTTTARPWDVSVPDSTAAEWRTFRQGVLQLVKGRPSTARDTVRSYLTLEAPRMSGDTVSLDFTVGGGRRCGMTNRWIGSSTGYTVTSIRTPHGWTAPVTEALEFGDSLHC